MDGATYSRYNAGAGHPRPLPSRAEALHSREGIPTGSEIMSSTMPRYAYADESGDAGYDFGANSSRCFVMGMAEHTATKVDGVLGRALRWPRIKKLLQLAFQASRLHGDDDSLEERNGKPFCRSYDSPDCLPTQKR
jgi:hypothetical protein